MIEQINIELLKLQEELSKLKSASEQIAQAGKLTQDVLAMGQTLNEKYRDYLKKVQDLVSEYMNKTYKHTEENLTKLFYSFQQRIKEEQEILDKFSQLSVQSEDLLKQVVNQILEDNKQKVKQLIEQISQALEQQKQMLDDYAQKTAESLAQLEKKYQENLEAEQQILASYLDLAEKTAKLTKFIESINFPKRLDGIDQKLASLNRKTDQYFDNLSNQQKDTTEQLNDKLEAVLNNQEELYAMIEKNRKRINGNKIVLWILLLLNLLFYAAATTAFLRLFTDFFDSFCK